MKEIVSLLVLFWYNLLTRRDLQLEIKKVGNYEENAMVTTIPSGYSWFFISADRLLDKDKFLSRVELTDVQYILFQETFEDAAQ